jgi:hypothetical protein
MKTIVARTALSPAIIVPAAPVCARQWATAAGDSCAVFGQRLRRAVSDRREALEHRLQEFVLELLAAIVLIAIFMIVADPATRQDS